MYQEKFGLLERCRHSSSVHHNARGTHMGLPMMLEGALGYANKRHQMNPAI